MRALKTHVIHEYSIYITRRLLPIQRCRNTSLIQPIEIGKYVFEAWIVPYVKNSLISFNG